MRSKKCVSSDGSRPVNGSPCETMLRGRPVAGSAVPDEILLDRHGEPGAERAIDAIRPAIGLGIAVVGVDQDARAGRERRSSIGSGRASERR